MAADQILFSSQEGDVVGTAAGSFDLNTVGEAILRVFNQFLEKAGDDPMSAMVWLMAHGGWAVFFILAFFAGRMLFLGWRQGLYGAKRGFVLLAIDIPRMSEQTVKAVDNMFAHLAGAHSPPTFLEKWWEGKTQDVISLEIVSIEGHIQYLIRTVDKLRDLIEASIYAQYPDAEIAEVEDYVPSAPNAYPNDTHECFAVELEIVKKPDVYPLKTYEEFEHGLTAEFKDPLAVLLEAFSRLGPGEQCWYQIVATPISQKEYVDMAKKVSRARWREVAPPKPPLAERVLNADSCAPPRRRRHGGSAFGEERRKESVRENAHDYAGRTEGH